MLFNLGGTNQQGYLQLLYNLHPASNLKSGGSDNVFGGSPLICKFSRTGCT